MFEYMSYIYEVYRSGSFSKAARNLFISQPALSASIRKAEEKLGFQIFNRQTNPLSLTEQGVIYIDSIMKIMEIESNTNDRLLELSNLQYGYLNLGGTNFFASCMLPLIIGPFSEQFPKITLQITEQDSVSLYRSHVDNDVDLIMDAGACDTTQYEIIPLINEHILLGVPRNNPVNSLLTRYQLSASDVLAKRHLDNSIPTPPLHTFQGQKMLLLNKHHDLHTRSMSICRDAGFLPTDIMYLNQLMTAYNFALYGIGIAFITDTVVYLSNRRDELLYYRFDHPQAKRLCFLAHHKIHSRTKAMEKFIETAQSVITEDLLVP